MRWRGWLSPPEVLLEVAPELVTFRWGERETEFAPVVWLAPEPPPRFLGVGTHADVREPSVCARPLDLDGTGWSAMRRDEILTALIYYGITSVQPRIPLIRAVVVVRGLERFPEEHRVPLAHMLGRALKANVHIRHARYDEPQLS